MIEQLSSRGLEAFHEDPAIKPAMERLMEIIGEAAGSLSENFRAQRPQTLLGLTSGDSGLCLLITTIMSTPDGFAQWRP